MRDPTHILARDAPARETDIVVVGAGQAGLSAAYHLKRLGLEPVTGFVVLDGALHPGAPGQSPRCVRKEVQRTQTQAVHVGP